MENTYRNRREKLASLLPEGAGALIFSGEEIPLTVANEHAGTTENTLYKVSNSVGTPADVRDTLNQRYP